MAVCLFDYLFEGYGSHRDLHSFPTRRSSDLDDDRSRKQERDLDRRVRKRAARARAPRRAGRSEEHTSELQSHSDLVCRLLLEKKKSAIGQRQPANFITTDIGPLDSSYRKTYD